MCLKSIGFLTCFVGIVGLGTTSDAAQTSGPDIVAFFGRAGGERAQDVYYDPVQDCVYIVGNTTSDSLQGKFTGVPGYDREYGSGGAFNSGDAFVAKFSSDLTTLQAWSYLGGDSTSPGGGDRGYAVRTDGDGNVYVYGFTESDFASKAPPQPGVPPPIILNPGLKGRRDVFLSKFEPDLGKETWRLILGGSLEPANGNALEQGRNTLFVDDVGNAFISGGTNCTDFFTTLGVPGTPIVPHNLVSDSNNPFNFDAFLVKVNKNGAVRWGTFFGGTGDESAYSGIELSAGGAIFVAGNTNQHEFQTSPPKYWGIGGHPGTGLPGTTGRYQETYAGGDHQGSLPTPTGGGYHHVVDGDGFVAKFDANGNLKWSTYLGGSGVDMITGNDGLRRNSAGYVHVIGATKSTDFPVHQASQPPNITVPAPFQANHSGADPSGVLRHDGFVTILKAGGTLLHRSTYIGGTGFEELSGLDIDAAGNIYFAGDTSSGLNPGIGGVYTEFPTTSTGLQVSSPKIYSSSFHSFDPVSTMIGKLDANLSFLNYSSYLGGSVDVSGDPSDQDRTRALQWVDGGACYIAGCTNSADFTTIHNPDLVTAPAPLHALDPGNVNSGTNKVDRDDAFVALWTLPTAPQQQ